jgi:hypothetical protein
MTREDISEYVDDEALTMDGFDSAIMGIAVKPCQNTVVAYDFELLVKQCEADGMSYDEAIEYIDYNIAGAYMGEGTPIIIRKLDTL